MDGSVLHDETGVDRNRPAGLREDGGGFLNGWVCLERTGLSFAGWGLFREDDGGFLMEDFGCPRCRFRQRDTGEILG